MVVQIVLLSFLSIAVIAGASKVDTVWRIPIGNGRNQIGFDSATGTEPKFTSSFAISRSGEIWIDDPVHHRIVNFTDSDISGEITTDSLIVDDMVFLDNHDLAVSFWNSAKVIVYRRGKPAYSCNLPHDPVAETNLYSGGRDLFVDFFLREDSTLFPHRIGLEFDSSGSLRRVRQDSAAMWAASCGLLHGNAIDSWYDYSLGALVDSTGRPWLSDSGESRNQVSEIGCDRMGNNYFLQRHSMGTDTGSLVVAYTPRGKRFRTLPIGDVDANSHHWIKVDRWGDVYILSSPWNSKEISIQRY
jgi:hypothetical protein